MMAKQSTFSSSSDALYALGDYGARITVMDSQRPTQLRGSHRGMTLGTNQLGGGIGLARRWLVSVSPS